MREERPGWSSPTHEEMKEFYGGSKMECSASLIELKNSIKQELDDEGSAAHKYADMAAKFTHLHEKTYADTLRLISGHEELHRLVLIGIIDEIELKCQ